MNLAETKPHNNKKDQLSNGSPSDSTHSDGHDKRKLSLTGQGQTPGHLGVEKHDDKKSISKRHTHTPISVNSDSDKHSDKPEKNIHRPSRRSLKSHKKLGHEGSVEGTKGSKLMANEGNEKSHLEDATRSVLLAQKRQLFDMTAGTYEAEQPSWVDDLRGYHSEPCFIIPFDKKFTLKKKRMKLPGMKTIGEKFMSMEDLRLDKNDYPELVTEPLSDTKLRDYAIDDTMMASWASIFELEKQRFSFFDELFAQGYIVDSLEVPRSVHKEEEEDYFIEAEEKDFHSKIDYGRVVFKTKHVYTGNMVDWYFQGPGRYVWVDGAVYQGEFLQGLMHGQGTIHWPDGSIYEGEFGNGTRAGWGVYSTSEGFTYAGDWLNGLPHGRGKMWYDPKNDDGDYYDGTWADGLQSGAGTRQYSNGDRYIGNWADGDRSGTGSMIWITDRQVYKGEWANGVPQGKGKHIWYLERSAMNAYPTRHIYTGDWNEGKRHGIGKMIYPCGSIYEGRWNNGQRHGKGVFLNAAGGIMTGVFRAGAITGGSDIPLHTPTYEYDFGGLVEWLTVKFNLNIENEMMEEENLADTTIRFLYPLRRLYKRTGVFGHTWGNNGLYPYWLKKSHPRHEHHIPNHNNADEPAHMGAKAAKPPSPDGVNPVTRFGMWLLIKDCPGLTDDVTLAYFDRHFSNTPSISFQTRHNPFEPISFWQFLQCLAIVAVTLNMEIPEQKHRWSSEDRDELSADSNESMVDDGPDVVTLKSPPSPGEEEDEMDPNISPDGASPLKKSVYDIDRPSQAHMKDRRTTLKQKAEAGVSNNETSLPSGANHVASPPSHPQGRRTTLGQGRKDEIGSETHLSNEVKPTESSEMPNGTISTTPQGDDGVPPPEDVPKKVTEEYIPFKQRPRVFNISIGEAFEAFLVDKLFPCLDREAGINLPPVPNPLPPIRDLYDTFKEINDRDWITATEFMQDYLPHKVFPQPSETIFWHRCPELLCPNVNLEEMFSFQKKLQSRPSGYFEDDRDEDDEDDDGVSLGPELLGSVSNIDIRGGNTSHGKAQKKEDHQDDAGDLHLKKKSSITDYVTDASPFCPEDLTSEPFLWQDEPTCRRVERKTQHYQNLTTHDVLNVLRFLYPKLVGHIVETNVDYNMIFCDWLWAVSLCAKVSADREFRGAIHTEKTNDGHRSNHRNRTQSAPHGVFAHHVKRIRNNMLMGPYSTPLPQRSKVLSTTPSTNEENEDEALEPISAN